MVKIVNIIKKIAWIIIKIITLWQVGPKKKNKDKNV